MSIEDRDRLAELWDALDREGGGGVPGARTELLQIIDGGSYPAAVPAMFLANATGIGVDETEGAAPTITADSAEVFPVLILGPLPAPGDVVIATTVGGRWVAGAQVPASDVVPSFCRGSDDTTICGIPKTLHFTDSLMGSCVLTYTGSTAGGWAGTFVYANPGITLACNGGLACPPKDLTITVKFYREGILCVFDVRCAYQSVSGSLRCPDDAGDIPAGISFGGAPTHVTCSPFGSSNSHDLAAAPCEVQLMYGADSGTVTHTVTL